MSTYIIDGTLDYTVTAARLGRPGRIVLRNIKADDNITISPLPVGDYTIAETASNYTPVFTLVETGSGEEPTVIEGSFSAEERELLIEYYKCVSFGIIADWCDKGMRDDYSDSFKKLLDLRRKMLATDYIK